LNALAFTCSVLPTFRPKGGNTGSAASGSEPSMVKRTAAPPVALVANTSWAFA